MRLVSLLRRLVSYGRFELIEANGARHVFQGVEGPKVVLRLADRAIARELALAPDPTLAEGWMDGRIIIEEGSLYDLLEICLVSQRRLGASRMTFMGNLGSWLLRRWHQYNPASKARSNVARHYDLSRELYRLFLDTDLQYSCAYFPHDGADLEQAQLAKKRHLAAKLLLEPGQNVLDIGSGWGGLGIYLAQVAEVDVTGITLSREQIDLATSRTAAYGLDQRVRFLLEDYRKVEGRFHRIVSVGMFEHVGVNHYRDYFAGIDRLLTDDGVALLHSIGRMDGPGYTSAFIRKHIFPGGYIPALSEIMPIIESQGLWITDIEILRLHYAETLAAWRQRFHARRDEVKAIYDERFCRMWDFYLTASEVFFRHQDGMVFQIQLAKDRHSVPLTRDYIFETERELARRERQRYRLVA